MKATTPPDPWPWTMPSEAARWVRDEVIGSYHWETWTGDWRTGTPANERNALCDPFPWPDEPAVYCSRRAPVCMLRAPRPYGPPDPRGGDRPDLYHSVWIADAPGAPRRAEQPEDWAAWVREHAWTDRMRTSYASAPDYWLHCECQKDYLSHGCRWGNHGLCGSGSAHIEPATRVARVGGMSPAVFEKEHRHHPRTVFSTRRSAMVWYTDRACRLFCRCTCHTAPAGPEPERQGPEQLDLLAEVG